MRISKLLSIYKSSIITDVGKQDITRGTDFDDIRSAALRKVHDEIFREVMREIERLHDGSVSEKNDVVTEVHRAIERLKLGNG